MSNQFNQLALFEGVADLQLTWDSDEETTSTFYLASNADEPQVKKVPRPAFKRASARRDEARRALYDHGGSSRRPGRKRAR